MQEQEVILVTENDEPIGTMAKLEAHQKGKLHRAFSVFVFDAEGKLLLQQRSLKKYHGAGLWTNTCCSHPFAGEETGRAARRRLQEEMGFTADLKKIFQFTYKAAVENSLIEYEYDHVFAGEYNGAVRINEEEVADFCYLSIAEIKNAIQQHPGKFTSWFKIAFPRIENWWQGEYQASVVSNEFINRKSKL